MKRSEFIKILTDSIAEGRKQNFPDLRRSEAAVSRISDEARAASPSGANIRRSTGRKRLNNSGRN